MADRHKEIKKRLFKMGYQPFTLQGVLRLGKLKPGSLFQLTTKLWECPAMSNLKECLRYAKITENR
jgi:hypothetical protein